MGRVLKIAIKKQADVSRIPNDFTSQTQGGGEMS